jgi:putative restriction endonuclease
MKLYVGVTDYDWFRLNASRSKLEEVNFWKPSVGSSFKALTTGEPFLFKLHSPRNFIVGGGFFAKFLQLPISLAWEAFGESNGAHSLKEVRERIGKYRRVSIGMSEDPQIGCVILVEPFFFDEPEWIKAPVDFALNTVQGKGYDLETGSGYKLWQAVSARLATRTVPVVESGPATLAAVESSRYGKPVIVEPRLGQGAFRVLVTEAYRRRCAITRERTLPVLESAHIHPYANGGRHELPNGILLRSDLHRLFDHGYITIDPDDRCVVVSKRIREEFMNGKDYYQLQGKPIEIPTEATAAPSRDNLLFHAQHVFR